MKIEPAKNHSIDKKESKNVFKAENSVFNSSTTRTTPETPAPATSVFAKILEENRKEKDNQTAAKSDSSDHDTKTSKSEKDEKVSRLRDGEKELEERNSRSGDSDARRDGDEEHQSQPIISLAAMQSQINSASENASPARSILHVADLERIISTIRTESFQNQKQVTIALRNSVLQGLQIRLTINENGKIKAEFLALDEQIKKQLNSRRKELSEILHNRSGLFSEVEVKSQNQNEKDRSAGGSPAGV